MQAPRIDLQIIPSFRNFERTLNRDVRNLGKAFGNSLSTEFSEAFDKALGESLAKASSGKLTSPIANTLSKDSDKAAEELFQKLRAAVLKGLADGSKEGTAAAEKDATAAAKRIAREQEKAAEQAAAAQVREARKTAALLEREAKKLTAVREREAAKASATAEREAKKITDTLEREAKKAAAVLERELVRAQQQAAREAEKAFGQTWAGKITKGLQAAIDRLPNVGDKILPGTPDAELERIRQQLLALRDIDLTVTLDEAAFQAEVQGALNALRLLNGQTARVQVEADTAAAMTELYAVLALAGVIDRTDPDVDVNVDADTAGARQQMSLLESATSVNLSRLQSLVALGGSIGLAIIPAAAGAAAAIGFLGTSALAAGAGLGVLVLGFGGIGEAVRALNTATQDAEKTTKSLGSAAIGVANAQDAVVGAERSLAAARRNAADAAVNAARRVSKAELALSDARRQAGRDAAEAVTRVRDAQADLGRAEVDARQAREDLTESYRDAQRAYDDLVSSIKSNSLSERQSILDVAEAQRELDRIKANPRATQEEREQAEITYGREVLQLEDIRRRRDELADEQAEATRKGIQGSDQVTTARERLASADERVGDAVAALGKALRDQNDQRIAGAREIADAEQALSEARLQQDRQAMDSADSLASASQALVGAQRQLEAAYLTSATAGGTALEKLDQAMGQLSPTAQEFARYIFNLKDEFLLLRAAASDGMLGGAQTAIERLLPNFGDLLDFVRRVSAGLGGLFVRFADDLNNPTFQRFFDYISATAVPSLDRLYTIGTNLTQGFINLFLAFTGVSTDVGGGLEELTEQFRMWSESLDSNQGFQRFLTYVTESAPQVWDLLREGAVFLARFVAAAAPIGTLVLQAFTLVLEQINKIPRDALTAIIAALSGVALALTILGAATAAYALGTAGAIVGAVGLYVAMVGVLYAESETFRNAIALVFNAVATAATWLWENAIRPAANGIGMVFTWLWEQVIRPIAMLIINYFRMIGGIWLDIYRNFIAPVVRAIAALFEAILFPVFNFLWNSVIKPVFQNIQVIFNVFKVAVQLLVGVLQIAFKVIGAVVQNVYTYVFKPIFDRLGELFNWLATVIEKHVAPKFDKGMQTLGKIFDKLRDYSRTPVRFIIETVLNNGILAGYNKLAKAFSVTPDNLSIPLPAGFASGGVLPGFTPGRDVHDFYSPTAGRLRLSGGEGIMRPELTRALGRSWLDSGNRAARAGGTAGVRNWLGGSIPKPRRRRRKRGEGDGLGDLFSYAKEKAKSTIAGIGDLLTDPAGGLRKIADRLFKLLPNGSSDFGRLITAIPRKIVDSMVEKAKSVFGLDLGGDDVGGIGGTQSGGNNLGGVKGMMALLHAVFPGLRLISGLRPGDRVPTGGLSYHGFNRAVDLPPLKEVAAWIRRTHGQGTRELITPWREYDLWNGKNVHYDDAIHNAHSYPANPHVHWAYDSGGIMPPGYGSWYNGTGKPEAVLTNEQWRNVATMVQHAETRGMGGNEYKFEFRDTNLTPDYLRALQDRDNTYQRINRAR